MSTSKGAFPALLASTLNVWGVFLRTSLSSPGPTAVTLLASTSSTTVGLKGLPVVDTEEESKDKMQRNTEGPIPTICQTYHILSFTNCNLPTFIPNSPCGTHTLKLGTYASPSGTHTYLTIWNLYLTCGPHTLLCGNHAYHVPPTP